VCEKFNGRIHIVLHAGYIFGRPTSTNRIGAPPSRFSEPTTIDRQHVETRVLKTGRQPGVIASIALPLMHHQDSG
jgi:hypothetical protein